MSNLTYELLGTRGVNLTNYGKKIKRLAALAGRRLKIEMKLRCKRR